MKSRLLENYKFDDIKNYLIFLEPTTPFDNGIFYTFDTEDDLLLVIREEILVYCGVGEDELDDSKNVLEELLPETIDQIDSEILEQINNLLPTWKIGYVGSLEGVMNDDGDSEKWFRRQFRENVGLNGSDEVIQPEEVEEFKIFMLPEWER